MFATIALTIGLTVAPAPKTILAPACQSLRAVNSVNPEVCTACVDGYQICYIAGHPIPRKCS